MGTGPNGAALVTAGDLAGISTAALNYASVSSARRVFFGTGLPSDRTGLPSDSLSLSDDAARETGAGQMTVRVGHNAAGQVSYGLTYTMIQNGVNELYRWTVDSEAAGTNVRRLGSGGRQGALFRREDSSGDLWAAVATDISGPGDTDWLATGFWAHNTTTGPRPDWSDGSWFGVFAGGGDPYGGDLDSDARAELITALTGAATYEGDASGVYSRSVGEFFDRSRRNDLFSADATLTIDFSAKPGLHGEGAATGRIYNMKIGGAPIAGNPEIALLNGEVWSEQIWVPGPKETSWTADSGWGGEWSAMLFGNPASGAAGADKLPGSVAGVFSVGDGERFSPTGGWRPEGDYIVGAFAAHRTGWTDAPEGVRQEAP